MTEVGHALVERLRSEAVARLGSGEVDREQLADVVDDLIDEHRIALSTRERDSSIAAVVDEALGLGPLETLLRDPGVTEIAVNGPSLVFVERDGHMSRSPVRFSDNAHLLHIIDRILAPLGRRVDAASPMVDARLSDGSRVNVVVPPLAVDGPCLSVRRFPVALGAEELLANGTVDASLLGVLRRIIVDRRNVLVTGGTGSGKTTTLAMLAGFIGDAERVITIEDAAELRIDLPHVVRLESRPASLQGGGAVSIRDLVRNALRMRPDRIVVGEVRGAEAVDMLAAMTTGHEGSLSTIHASSPEDAIRRLQLLVAMGDLELSYEAVADQVVSAIDVIVHQARLPDGRRRVLSVSDVSADIGTGPRVVSRARWSSESDSFRLEGSL